MEKLTLQEQTVLFFNSCRSIEKLYEQYAKSLGMSYIGLIVLEMIYNSSEICTQKSICEQTNLPKQSVNVVIKSLWEQGYVEMKELVSDRRNKEIRLTESGRMFAKSVIDKILDTERKVFGQITYDQRQVIIELFQNAEIGLKEIINGNIIDDCNPLKW